MTKRNVIRLAVRRFFNEPEPLPEPAPAPTPAPNPAPNPAPQPRTYSETEYNRLVNSKLAEEKRKSAEANKKVVEQLQSLQQNVQLTEQEKASLQAQIDELQATYRSAEETKKIELEKQQNKYDKDTKLLAVERDSWRTRYENNMIDVDITNAAVVHEAVSPEQIKAFLRPLTRCVEKLDEANKPTGQYVTRVKFEDTDADGKPVILDLDTAAAVKLMRDRANRFGNLFKNTTNGGTGTLVNPNPVSGNGVSDIMKMSPQEYLKNRDKIHAEMRASGGK